MRASYKYRLIYDAGWKLELLPNNSNTQYVGQSDSYCQKEDAVSALNRWKTYLGDKQLPQISMEKSKDDMGMRYRAVLFIPGTEDSFYTRWYEHNWEVPKGIQRILEHFDSPVRSDLAIRRK